jgi:hypothetical protein
MRTLSKAVFAMALAAAVLSPTAYAQRDDDRREGGERHDRDDRHDGPYGRARDLIGRVQHDLARAQKMAPVAGRQRERYENAQRHLSEFDDRLSRGDFDKDKLDTAIDDVNNVFKSNVLSPHSRDDLRGDLADLRSMRTARGKI